jgi:dihydropteroate synthase
VGGESTRPGAAAVEAAEERRRVEPVIRRIRQATNVPISIDTTKAEVARMALAEGADLVNDISALRDDPAMAGLALETGAPVILMHRRGTVRDMQDDPRYDDVTREVLQFLARRVRELSDQGLDPEKMVVDPGIGFGKTVEHNLALLRDVDELRSLGRPVLVGASRKSFMAKLPGGSTEMKKEVRTLAAHGAAALGGAAALRVHDVVLHRELLRVLWAIAGQPASTAGGPPAEAG